MAGCRSEYGSTKTWAPPLSESELPLTHNEIVRRADLSRDDHVVSRTYTFRLMVDVDEGHEGYDDPEWRTDAAWGALTNLYGLRCVYTDVELLPESPVASG